MKVLKIRGRVHGVLAVLLLGAMSAPTYAATVTQELFESTTLVTGTSMHLTELNLTTPGTLVIELDDLNWPGPLDKLSFSLTDATNVLQTFTVPEGVANNTWTFAVTAPGTFYGSIFAKPSATALAGSYYANVSYESVAAVPLPGAAWFLMSGIAALAAFRPKQRLSQV